MRRSRVPASRSSTPTGSATRPARRPASIRTSGAGTRRASRSPTRTSTRRAPRPSCARCSRASGATASCRTSASPTGRATSPAPSSGRPSSRRTRRRTRARRGSSSRRCTRPRSGRSTATPPTPSGRRRSCASSCRSSPPGTTTSTASAPATARGSSRSGIRGSRASTTRRSGTRRSARITPPQDEIPEYQRVDTEVVDSSQRPTNAEYDRYAYLVKCYRERGYDQARIRAECPFAIQDVLFNSILVQAGEDLASIARVVGEDPEPFERAAGNDTIEPRLEALERGRRHVPRLRPARRRADPRPARGAGSRRSTAASSPRAGGAAARDGSRVRRHARRRLGGRRRCRPTIPRSTRPATGAGRSGR